MKTFEIIVFNVGHGDNILLKFLDGSYGVIDFNYDRLINSLGECPAITYLKKFKREEINLQLLNISHFDEDHIVGLNSFFEWATGEETLIKPKEEPINIKEVWLSCYDDRQFYEVLEEPEVLSTSKREGHVTEDKSLINKSRGFDKFKRKNKKKVNYICREIDDLEIDRHKVLCLSPKHKDVINFTEMLREGRCIDRNLMSTIILFSFNERKFLFGGDADRVRWNFALDFYKGKYEKEFRSIESDFMKVSHHGSDSSSEVKIWETLLPSEKESYLAISAGNRDEMRFPNDTTITHIKEASEKKQTDVHIYCTNEKIILGKHDIEPIEWPESEIRNKKRYGARFGMNAKDPETKINTDFIGYKFIYDFDKDNIEVKKLMKDKKTFKGQQKSEAIEENLSR